MSSYELKDADRFVDDTAVKLHAASMRGLLSAAHRGVQAITTRIIPSRTPQPVDRGVYRAGWRAGALDDGAFIENLEPVAILIEEGVRGSNVKIGRAMIQALASWVQRKGIADAKDAQHVAWAIAKNMQKRGIFGGGGGGFFAGVASLFGGAAGGLGILRELVEKDLDGFMAEEIEREIQKEFGT